MKGDFPFEPIRFKLSGKCVCSSPQLSLEKDWGYRTARALFAEEDIIQTEDFHLVRWDGLDSTMTGYPKMYGVWLTKHVSEFCGSNVQLYYWSRGRQSPKCESCGIADKYTMHISRCRDPGCDSMFRDKVQDLGCWMVKTLGKENISATVTMYLLSQGGTLMTDCVHGGNQELINVARERDRLGCDSLLEGRITTLWLPLVSQLLSKLSCSLLPLSWGRKFINKLHNIIHKQWIYPNTFIHYWDTDGLTTLEHHKIINRVEEYALIDPEELLPRHQYLMEAAFETLGSSLAYNRQIWLVNVDSAVAATTLAQVGTLTPAAVVTSRRQDDEGGGSGGL